MINTYGQLFIEYAQFKDQLIQMRKKLNLDLTTDRADFLNIRSINYQQYISHKNLTNFNMKNIGTKNDLRFKVITKITCVLMCYIENIKNIKLNFLFIFTGSFLTVHKFK